MKAVKRGIAILLSIIMMIGASGCMRVNKPTEKDFLEYLSKYDDVFTDYRLSGGGSPGSKSKEVIFKPAKYPDYMVTVTWNYAGGRYVDNYIPIKYHSRLEGLVENIAQKAFGDCTVINESSLLNGTSPANADESFTFDDYIASKSAILSLIFVVDVSDRELDYEGSIEKLKALILENNIFFLRVNVYFTDSYDLKENKEAYTYSSMISHEKYLRHFSATMSSSEAFNSSVWER